MTDKPGPVALAEFACPTCKAAVKSRCVTATGNPTTPHIQRWRLAEGWIARQAEVDAAQHALEQADALLTAANDGLRAITSERDLLKADLQRVNIELSGVRDQVRTLTRDLAATVSERDVLRVRVFELEHPPAPQPTTFRIGAGGGNLDRTKTGINIDAFYGGSGDVDKAVARAKANHAAGILTWISFKLPFSWADMAGGKGDAWAKDLFAKLDALGFEVWVAFHHEPEGDGDLKLWTKLQDRLSRLVPGGIEGDVKFWLVVTGYAQEFGSNASYKWEAIYPTGAPIYGIGYDFPYNPYGAVWDKTTGTKTSQFNDSWTEGTVYVDKLAARAKALGVKAAVREMAYSDEAFARDPEWLDRVYASAKRQGLLACVYFDTKLNSVKSWYLGAADSAKRAHFNALVGENVR